MNLGPSMRPECFLDSSSECPAIMDNLLRKVNYDLSILLVDVELSRGLGGGNVGKAHRCTSGLQCHRAIRKDGRKSAWGFQDTYPVSPGGGSQQQPHRHVRLEKSVGDTMDSQHGGRQVTADHEEVKGPGSTRAVTWGLNDATDQLRKAGCIVLLGVQLKSPPRIHGPLITLRTLVT